MSRERALLERWVMQNNFAEYYALREETLTFLAQPKEQLEEDKKSKVDFQTLSEMGLKRLQVSNDLVLQESCAKSPTALLAENGNLIEIIEYKKLLEIRNFIDEILNYADTPPNRSK
jgi:hypothetical protein